MRMKASLWSRLFGGSSDTAVKEQQTQEAKEQSFRVQPFEELPQLQTMDKNTEALKKISAEYYRSCYDFIKLFPQKIVELEQQKNVELKKIEEKYREKRKEEFYKEKTVHAAGTICTVRDDDAIKQHYQNLIEEEKKAKAKLMFSYKKKKATAQTRRKEFKENIKEMHFLEKKIKRKNLVYGAILPERIVKVWIREMYHLYNFERKIDNEGRFNLLVQSLDDVRTKERNYWYSIRQISALESQIKTCFGAAHHFFDETRNIIYILGSGELDVSAHGYISLRKYGVDKVPKSLHPPYDGTLATPHFYVAGKVIFSTPNAEIAERIVKWRNNGYIIYNVAQEKAFSIYEQKDEDVDIHKQKENDIFRGDCLTGDVISVARISDNMVAMIAIHGKSSTLEHQLLTQAKVWFQKIHREYFSFE